MLSFKTRRFHFFFPMKPGCGHESCTLSSLRGLRNGLEYAIRIRVAHCLVMILLYKRDQSLKSNAMFLFNAAKEHSLNLGSFVFFFKLLKCQLQNRAGFSAEGASFVAGGLVGSLVWGRTRSAINYQVVLYLLSRITTGLIHHQVNKGKLPDVPAFRPLAGFVWAVVMYLFTIDPDSLQGSLRSSMEFLYNDDKIPESNSRLGIPGFILPFVPFSGN